ncbi:hypothetical protein [Streptomyces sp. NPDC051636]|uniref:hypothetical protein n=1 Tax=Streptomyces sp. NPDC051636 TaxID=3365663 RepID=UPI0037A90AEF
MAESLAAAVEEEWNKEAGLRRLKARVVDETPLSVRWEVSGHRVTDRAAGATAEGMRDNFRPLPGLRVVTHEQLLEGGGLEELHEVYGGLASGRILLVGREAAGKTAALVLLLLKALEYRREAKSRGPAAHPCPGPPRTGIPGRRARWTGRRRRSRASTGSASPRRPVSC